MSEVKNTETKPESTITVSSAEDDAKTLGGVEEVEQETKEPVTVETKEKAEEPRKKNSAKKRIQGLVRESKDKDDRIAELESKLDERKPEKADEKAKEPNIDDFETFEEYEKELETFNTKEVQAPKEEKPKESTVPKEEIRANEAYQDLDPLLDDARDTHEDFNKVVGNDKLQITVELMENLTAFDDNAGEMLYLLANDADRLAEIADMGEKAQLKELIKLEAEIGNPKKAPVKKHSNAPEPIDVVNNGSDKVKSLDDDDLSFQEHQKLLNSRQKVSRGGFL